MPDPLTERIYLSPPHLSGEELGLVEEVFESNWIAPLGPQVDAFEAEFAAEVGMEHAVALSSGTAALHLALRIAGVGSGDEVVVPSLTFVASANPVRYLGAEPVFVDSDPVSWCMDPALVEEVFRSRRRAGRPLPAAVVPVHLYGHPTDIEPIRELCDADGVPLVEDAAEALGALYDGRPAGSFGQSSVFSFNGNKIITTSGGGMLVTNEKEVADRVRKLATQARDPAPHYQHSELGYNYRVSNLLAAVGRAQLRRLDDRVRARRENFERYRSLLGEVPGLSFQSEAPWGYHTRWLTCILVDRASFGTGPEAIRLALEEENIEARPIWKPMHLQPLYEESEMVGGQVAEDVFRRGLCLPSGSSLTEKDLERIARVIRKVHREAKG